MDSSRYKPLKNGRSLRSRSVDGFVVPRRGSSATHSQQPALPTSPSTHRKLPSLLNQNIPNRAYPKYIEPRRPLRPVKRRHIVRTWTLRFASVLIVAFLATGGFLSWRGYSSVHRVFRGSTTVAALASDHVNPDLLNGEGDGRVNILLLGIGGAGHDGPDLTDTMLVLSVDPVNHTAALLSIPRDLWVKMPTNFFGNYQKINAAYESAKYSYIGKLDASNSNEKALRAGFAADDALIKQILGININYHMLVDFQAFRQAIDTVGGVPVDVKSQLYDPTMAWENHNNPVLAAAGLQDMDGKEALLYARSRETSSDFARTERQRQILLALKDKVLSAGTLSNPAKIDSLLNAFGNNLYSDLSTKGAQRLYTIMKQIDNGDIKSIGLADPPNNFVTTDHIGNISVVRPRSGFNNYVEIQKYVRSQLKDGYILKENAAITVVNGSATPSTTQAVAADLKLYGYNVTNVITTEHAFSSQNTSVVDLSQGKNPYSKRYLEERYHTKAVTKLPSGIAVQPDSAKFVIIQGQDEVSNN
ncbi:MAG: LCP family protein [Candidatus Saccharimonadales bacterium]